MMKKAILFITVLMATGVLVNAQQKGGMGPCIASCCVGPRVGLEMNEGKPIETAELVNVCIPCIMPFKAFEKNGFNGCIWAGCVGPRVGMQLDYRKPRNIERYIFYTSLASYVVNNVYQNLLLAEGYYPWDPGAMEHYQVLGLVANALSLANSVGYIMICFEAYNGTTMTEIEQRENLRTGGQKYEQIK